MTNSELDIPTIDAIFVVRFDTRQGNVLEWSSSVPGIQLRGVEFSALPSGLHNSSQDVIYFHLEGCVGVAVFANVPSSNVEHRGAQMISVGVLVKPSADTGRCGQVWRHVDFLKRQAIRHSDHGADTSDLDNYFMSHRTPQHAGPSSSAKRESYRARNLRRISRSLTISEPVGGSLSLSIGQYESVEMDDIPSSHPSQHFLKLVQAMGPSIYILWKAALLKKRILIYTQPPIESACLYVYNTCLMATIPSEVTSISQHKVTERMQPLFCVGIHDIDHMSALRGGYVACTTDRLFLFKPHLYDVLVDLSAPPSKTTHPSPRTSHPRIRIIRGETNAQDAEEWHPNTVDRRRYFSLLQQLGHYRRRQEWMQRRLVESTSVEDDADTEEAMTHHDLEMPASGVPSEGFNMSGTLGKMVAGGWWWWWWYGGEDAEDGEHAPLIPRTPEYRPNQGSQSGSRPESGASLQVLRRLSGSSDTEAIRFFHNLTSILLTELGRLVSFKMTAAIFEDDSAPEGTGVGVTAQVEVSRQDMRQLGLEPHKDRGFVQELGHVYFECEVHMKENSFGRWCSQVCCCSCVQ